MTEVVTGLIRRGGAYVARVRGFRRNARALLLAQSLHATAFGAFMVFFNVYLKRGGHHEDFVGALASITMVTTVIVAIPVGLLVSRIGLRRGFLWALPVMSCAMALQSLTVAPGLLVALATVSGFSQMLMNAALFPLLAANSDEHDRRYVFSVSWGLMNLAGVIGSLIGGLVPDLLRAVLGVSEFTALRVTLLGVAVCAAAAALPACSIAETPRARIRAGEAVWWRRRPQRLGIYAKFAALNVVLGLGAGFTIPFLSLFFTTEFGLRPSAIGYLFSISGAVTGLAALSSPFLVGRFGKLRAMIIPQAVSIPFLVTLAHSRSLWLSVPAFWIRGALMNAGAPVMNQIVMEESSDDARPVVTNLTSLSWNAGWSLSVAVSGVVISRQGYLVPFYATIGVYLVYVALLAVFFRRHPGMGKMAAAS